MSTLTEKANAYIAALPVEERFAALRGFFAGAEEVVLVNLSGLDTVSTFQEMFEEIETFNASDYRQQPKIVAETPQRTLMVGGRGGFRNNL